MARQTAKWSGTSAIRGASEPIRLALLTAPLAGFSFCWGFEMTYCMPYLLELGLSNSRTSLVWIAGPLSGLITAPVIGAISDDSRSRWGRRRPFMLVGSLAVVISLFLLTWAQDLCDFLVGHESGTAKTPLALFIAIVMIYTLDFAINISEAAARSLVIDSLPVERQQSGMAWAARMGAVGHLVGYAVGAIDLRSIFGSLLGNTQIKQMAFLTAMILAAITCATAWAVQERVLVSSSDNKPFNTRRVLTKIFHAQWNMSPNMRAIVRTQFFLWLAWFPFLFYGSAWVGETYLAYDKRPQADVGKSASDETSEIARLGSEALVVYSCVMLAASVILPWFIHSPDHDAHNVRARPILGLQAYRPSLVTAYQVGNLVLAAALLCAPLVGSWQWASVLVGICGIPKAFTNWAPFTFVGLEVSRLSKSATSLPLPTFQPGESDDFDNDGLLEQDPLDGMDSVPLSGVYLGILNVWTTLPQFVGTLICGAVFLAFEFFEQKDNSADDPSTDSTSKSPAALAAALFLGGLSAVAAGISTAKLRDTL